MRRLQPAVMYAVLRGEIMTPTAVNVCWNRLFRTSWPHVGAHGWASAAHRRQARVLNGVWRLQSLLAREIAE